MPEKKRRYDPGTKTYYETEEKSAGEVENAVAMQGEKYTGDLTKIKGAKKGAGPKNPEPKATDYPDLASYARARKAWLAKEQAPEGEAQKRAIVGKPAPTATPTPRPK